MVNDSNVLSPQRAAILRWAARLGVVTASALAERERCAIASARARLLAAEQAGLLSRSRPLADGPALFSVTRAGLRAVGMRELEPAHVTAANARHAAVCARVAVTLERAYPEHALMGERELRAEERIGGRALASARLRNRADGRLLHRPDLVLWPAAGAAPVAVEVELTPKGARRLLEICRAWARCRCVGGVLYFAAPEVRRGLARAIEKADASERIVVIALEALEAS